MTSYMPSVKAKHLRFGRALKSARKSTGMTQLSLSRRLSVDPMTISRWERGEAWPNRWLLPVLAQIFPQLAAYSANDTARKAG